MRGNFLSAEDADFFFRLTQSRSANADLMVATHDTAAFTWCDPNPMAPESQRGEEKSVTMSNLQSHADSGLPILPSVESEAPRTLEMLATSK
jgi:hypothetical protein